MASTPQAETPPSANFEQRRDQEKERRVLGNAIRSLRKRQGRTLNDVASVAGVSVSLLSQVERGGADPSLDTLRDIADALGTAPFRLLAGAPSRSRLIRAGDGPRLTLPDTEVELQLLSPSLDGSFEVVRWALRPGGSSTREPRGHPGEEAALILSGRVRFELGDEVFELSEGDFITYDARVPHRTIALGDEQANGIFVLSPPSF